MSKLPKETPEDKFDAEAVDLTPDRAASELPDPEAEEEEDEEEGECGFCVFMKGGACRDPFINWEKCVQEAEKNNEDLLEKCAHVTAALKQCMDVHADYYEPILRAEKLVEEQAAADLEKAKQFAEQPPPIHEEKANNVVEEVATIELVKEKQNLSPNESQSPSPSSQDTK